jgi:predicted RNA-binding protein with PUA-like domain
VEQAKQFHLASQKNDKTNKDFLSPHTRKAYDRASTYHDGKWLLLTIDSNKIVEDVLKLLTVKRKPKNN